MLNKIQQLAVFCPVCRTKRHLPKFSTPWFSILGLSLLWAVLVASVVGLGFGLSAGLWSGFVLSGLGVLGLETYYRLQFKKELSCPVCHFDPVFFRKSPKEAEKKFLEAISNNKTLIEKWNALKKQNLHSPISTD